MGLTDELKFDDVFIQPVNDDVFTQAQITVHVLRLDQLHPVVSGNKFFKLKYYLQEAAENNAVEIATFGGAFSNHIIATAYACNKLQLACTGFVRGDTPKQYSQTLLDAKALNMQLVFISREAYRNKEKIMQENVGTYFIPEGGYGNKGAKGAGDILQLVPAFENYDTAFCATGTGTMLAGLTNRCLSHQQCIGISVMKNNKGLKAEALQLLNKKKHDQMKLLHQYHFGGYARCTDELVAFMNDTYKHHQLPLDFVYTAKAFYALKDLAKNNFFNKGSKIVFIHSGGLQGNRSITDRLIY